MTRNLQHCRMDCRWKRGIFFFYEAGKDKDEGEKKRGFCGQCYEACFSDGFEYSVFLPGLLSTVLDSVTRALFPENPLGSSFLSALCGSRSRCLHFSPWQLQQLKALSPLCVLRLSHLIFSAPGPVFPLLHPGKSYSGVQLLFFLEKWRGFWPDFSCSKDAKNTRI